MEADCLSSTAESADEFKKSASRFFFFFYKCVKVSTNKQKLFFPHKKLKSFEEKSKKLTAKSSLIQDWYCWTLSVNCELVSGEGGGGVGAGDNTQVKNI